ncbi:MAG: RNA methyltransferase [bacterium]|nr:RNA methyltransferase [bacterium]
MAKDMVEYTFSVEDTEYFKELVSTQAPQSIAAVARIPQWAKLDIEKSRTIVVLDGVQDPGNVGTILRLCSGFDATVLALESVDITNPKVIRSSAGAMFMVPWLKMNRPNGHAYLEKLSASRKIFRLEKKSNGKNIEELTTASDIILIAGSEGNGIILDTTGTSISINHNKNLESLNISHALAIALHSRYQAHT